MLNLNFPYQKKSILIQIFRPKGWGGLAKSDFFKIILFQKGLGQSEFSSSEKKLGLIIHFVQKGAPTPSLIPMLLLLLLLKLLMLMFVLMCSVLTIKNGSIAYFFPHKCATL